MQEDVSPQQVDILRESGHEHFSGSVVFPVFDLKRRGGGP
jgi:hypothetical protein